MAIEIYHGKYITADDATKIIDMPTINDGCRMLKEASDKLEQLSKKIDTLKQICDREAISVGGQNMEEIIEAYEINTKKFSEYINDLSNSLRNTTQRVVNRKQTVLNEEARRLDEKEAILHNKKTSPEMHPISEYKEEDFMLSPPTDCDAVYNPEFDIMIKNKPTDYDVVYNPDLDITIKNKPTDYDAIYNPDLDITIKNKPTGFQEVSSSSVDTKEL